MSTVFFARVDCVVPFCGIFWNWIGFYGFFFKKKNWFAIVSRGLGWMVPGFYLVLLGFSSIGERPAALSESFQSVFARHCRIWSALTRRWDSQTSPKKKLFFHSNPFQRLFAFFLSTSPPPASHLRSLSSKQLVLVFFPPRHRLIWNAGTLERWNAHSLADSDRVLLGFTGFYWVLLGFTGFYWVLLGFIGFYWVLLGFTGFRHWFSRRLLGFIGFDWVLPTRSLAIQIYWNVRPLVQSEFVPDLVPATNKKMKKKKKKKMEKKKKKKRSVFVLMFNQRRTRCKIQFKKKIEKKIHFISPPPPPPPKKKTPTHTHKSTGQELGRHRKRWVREREINRWKGGNGKYGTPTSSWRRCRRSSGRHCSELFILKKNKKTR